MTTFRSRACIADLLVQRSQHPYIAQQRIYLEAELVFAPTVLIDKETNVPYVWHDDRYINYTTGVVLAHGEEECQVAREDIARYRVLSTHP